MRPNPAADRERSRDEARDALIRAAAALTDIPTAENVGAALFWSSLAVVRIAEADPDERGRAFCEQLVAYARGRFEDRAPREPSP